MTDHNYSEIWELSLQDAVRIALENSKVMRQLGGRQASFGGQRPQQDEFPTQLLQAPLQVPTVYDPAIVEADPNFGVEAALSDFDAQLGSQLLWQKNERPQQTTTRRSVCRANLSPNQHSGYRSVEHNAKQANGDGWSIRSCLEHHFHGQQ